jgi:hypothetical protein
MNIHELPDQPWTGHAIDLDALARDPFHPMPPDVCFKSCSHWQLADLGGLAQSLGVAVKSSKYM